MAGALALRPRARDRLRGQRFTRAKASCNDLDPAKGAASFSYGPALAKRFGRRYVALDLIVPELITDNKLWRSQPWRDDYDPAAHPDETILFHPRDGEYALIFPRSSLNP